jgi:uncharacterized protein
MRVLLVGALATLGWAGHALAADSIKGTFTEDAFGRAIVEGNNEAVRLFLRLGMNANYRLERGGPALVMAAGSCQREPEEGRFDILRALLEAKATVDAKAEHEVTPLLRAVLSGCPVEFVEALVRAGANVNVKTKTGFSVLYIAEDRGYDDIVNVLRKAGAR